MKDDLKHLIDRYLEGEDLSAEERSQLNTALKSDPEAIAWLAERSMLMADVHRSLRRRALIREVMPKPVRWRSASLRWAAAALIVLSLTLWQITRPQVRMLRSIGTELVNGEMIGRDFDLPSGLVELSFRQSDASLVIEAPASFRVIDAKTIRIHSGRIAAHVKDGHEGLRVLTPDTSVLDLGTRFAVDVVPGQRSEVHVFEGKVEASDRPLIANEALRFTAHTAPESRQIRSGTFVQPEEVTSLAAAYRSGQQSRAAKAADDLRRDAATLAFLDFKPSADTQHLATGQSVTGARWVQGRFPGHHALEFLEADDHVRLDLPHEARQLTLMTWVRLDRVPGGAASIFLTDDWKTPGQIHWMMHNEGGMIFAQYHQRFPKEEQRVTWWPRSVLPVTTDLGAWMHLAFVYDADAKTARFYANGQPDRSVTLLADLPAVLGPAQIGNWNIKDWRDANPVFNRHDRRLSGRMDEFAVLTRALTAAEIAAYFKNTTPYQ